MAGVVLPDVVFREADAAVEPRHPRSPHGSVLVIDGDRDVRESLRSALQREGLAVSEATDVTSGLASARCGAPDLVILDPGPPDGSRGALIRDVSGSLRAPIILVSSFGDLRDRLTGLDVGADAYVAKPFSPQEVAARAKSILRRQGCGWRGGLLRCHGLNIDLTQRQVERDGVAVALTGREFELLAFLANSARHVFTVDELLQRVWDARPDQQNKKTVSVHVYRLRQKLELDPASPERLVTVGGLGYRFDP